MKFGCDIEMELFNVTTIIHNLLLLHLWVICGGQTAEVQPAMYRNWTVLPEPYYSASMTTETPRQFTSERICKNGTSQRDPTERNFTSTRSTFWPSFWADSTRGSSRQNSVSDDPALGLMAEGHALRGNQTHSSGRKLRLTDDAETIEEGLRADAVSLNLYAKDCAVKLIADDYFFREAGVMDPGTTKGLMTHNLQEADRLIRGMDFNSDGILDRVGFRVADVTILPPPDVKEELGCRDLFQKVKTYSDRSVCYVLLFTHRKYLGTRCQGYSHGWTDKDKARDSYGGICAGTYRVKDGTIYPNVGFVNLGSVPDVTSNDATIETVSVLLHAFGANNTDYKMGVGKEGTIVLNDFPIGQHVMNNVLVKHSDCFVPILFPWSNIVQDVDYYDAGAPSYQFFKLPAGILTSLLMPLLITNAFY